MVYLHPIHGHRRRGRGHILSTVATIIEAVGSDAPEGPLGHDPGSVARGGPAQRRDDGAAVGLHLGLLVAVHQVEVELVHAGICELT